MALNHSPKIITNGLVHAYDFENILSYTGSGSTVNSLVSNATGTTTGTSFNSTSPKSFSFGGDGDNINLSHGPIFNSALAGTIIVWADQDSTKTQIQTLYQEGDGNGLGTEKEFHFHVNTNDTLGFFAESANGTGLSFNGSTATTANTFFCGAVSFTGFTSSPMSGKIYLNGVLDGSGSLSSTYGGVGTPTISKIGSMHDTSFPSGNPRAIKGKVAAVYIYNRQLTDTEIFKNYTALRGRYGL